MRGLIYRELIHRRKKTRIQLFILSCLTLLIVLVQLSFRYGNLRPEIFGEAAYFILHLYLYLLSLVIPLMCSKTLTQYHPDDIASGFAGYSITLPVPVWKFTAARILVSTALHCIGAMFTFGAALLIALISGEPLSPLVAKMLLCGILLLQIISIYETVLSYLPFKRGTNLFLNTISEILLFAILPLSLLYHKIRTFFLEISARVNAINKQGIMTDSDVEAMLHDIVQSITDKITPFLNLVTKFAPLIYLGGAVLGFFCATLLLKWRRKNAETDRFVIQRILSEQIFLSGVTDWHFGV